MFFPVYRIGSLHVCHRRNVTNKLYMYIMYMYMYQQIDDVHLSDRVSRKL
jgi:hypothetical protein